MKAGARRIDPRAGKPAEPAMLVDVPRLMTAYFTRRPDASVRAQQVAFGTSGHRGSAFDCACICDGQSADGRPTARAHPVGSFEVDGSGNRVGISGNREGGQR